MIAALYGTITYALSTGFDIAHMTGTYVCTHSPRVLKISATFIHFPRPRQLGGGSEVARLRILNVPEPLFSKENVAGDLLDLKTQNSCSFSAVFFPLHI